MARLVFLNVFALLVIAPCYLAEEDPVYTSHTYARCVMEPSSNPSHRHGTNIGGTVLMKMTKSLTGACDLTEVKVNLTGFVPHNHIRAYGFHVHEWGSMADDCSSTGDDYNPLGVAGAVHGAPNMNPYNRHQGDLGNLFVLPGSDSVETLLVDYLIRLDREFNVIGRGLVIHANADDLGLTGVGDSLTTGNAGDGMACCVLGLTEIEE